MVVVGAEHVPNVHYFFISSTVGGFGRRSSSRGKAPCIHIEGSKVESGWSYR